jgi:hypothetical protein
VSCAQTVAGTTRRCTSKADRVEATGDSIFAWLTAVPGDLAHYDDEFPLSRWCPARAEFPVCTLLRAASAPH